MTRLLYRLSTVTILTLAVLSTTIGTSAKVYFDKLTSKKISQSTDSCTNYRFEVLNRLYSLDSDIATLQGKNIVIDSQNTVTSILMAIDTALGYGSLKIESHDQYQSVRNTAAANLVAGSFSISENNKVKTGNKKTIDQKKAEFQKALNNYYKKCPLKRSQNQKNIAIKAITKPKSKSTI
jgi:hypothetical protein